MEFNYVADGIDAVVIDNFYTEEQLSEIMLELKWLTKPSILLSEKDLVTAETNGVYVASKNGIFLETVFKDWRYSALISHGMTQTKSPEFREGLLKCNSMFKSLFECNIRSHLLSYYENADYYKPHQDGFFFTILNYFNVEPKQFTGGEIVLKSCTSNKEASIEPMNNRTVVILSATVHEVRELKSSLNNSFSGNGRYCNATFLTYMDPRELNDSN
jgi:hypothetical protein